MEGRIRIASQVIGKRSANSISYLPDPPMFHFIYMSFGKGIYLNADAG